MNFWWVNQNQTSTQEIGGGYLWSPKLNKDGYKQPSYENMKDIEPGDLILAYSGKQVGHYGIATGRAISSPKPEEFGTLGSWWSKDGWCVPVKWEEIAPVERDAVGRVAEKIFHEFENPFTVKGTIQQRYLCRITKAAVDFILGQARVSEAQFMEASLRTEPEFFVAESAMDGYVEKAIESAVEISASEKKSVVLARRGQGIFRENVRRLERRCRLTGVEDDRLLIAGHIKPWRSCETTQERLDGHNGLMLTPTMDRLFDRRYLTFENDGTAILSKKLQPETYERIGLNSGMPINVGKFSEGQAKYLQFHREIFLG